MVETRRIRRKTFDRQTDRSSLEYSYGIFQLLIMADAIVSSHLLAVLFTIIKAASKENCHIRRTIIQ